MIGIIVREGEPLNKALRRFKKVCDDSGILKELKKRQEFEKPSAIRRRAKMEAIKKYNKIRRKQLEEQEKEDKMKCILESKS